MLSGKKFNNIDDVNSFHLLSYNNKKFFKYQNLFLILKILPLKFDLKGLIPNEIVNISFNHDTIKNHFWINRIKKELINYISNYNELSISKLSISKDITLLKQISNSVKYEPEDIYIKE